MKKNKRWILPLALALVAAMAGLLSGSGSKSTPSTPQVTYPWLDLTDGSTWTYLVKDQQDDGSGGTIEVEYRITRTVKGPKSFEGNPDAVQVEDRVEGIPMVMYSYYRTVANGIGLLGSEAWDESGETPRLMERSVLEELLVFPSDLKVGDVVNQSVQQTTQDYDLDGNPVGPPEPGTASINFTVAALETVTVGGQQVSALKLAQPESVGWLGPNGVGVVREVKEDGVHGTFLESYDLN